MANVRTEGSPQKSETLQFCDLDISQDLKKGIEELGYVTPTAFQNGVFENFKLGKNIIGKGPNYGKSLAFSMPIVTKIHRESQTLQALIICDSPKLCELASKECRALGQHLNISVNYSGSTNPDVNTQIFVCTSADLPKIINSHAAPELNTIFFDGLSKTNTQAALEHLLPILNKKDTQILIFGETTLSAFENGAQKYIESAIYVDNIDMPKTIEPTKHIYHLQNDDEPKPRALLAALELHQPKGTLITCEDSAECEFLSRYLARFGYKIKVASVEVNSSGLAQGIKDVQLGKLDIFIVQNALLVDANLENVPFMILYNMIEQPQDYERVTQFAKKSPGVERTIVSLLCNRDLGCLGPIKAQCQVDFSKVVLPSDDAVNELCAKRIAKNLAHDASEVELFQYEILAKHILALDCAPAVVALLLKNHLTNLAKVEERRPSRLPDAHSAPREREAHERRSPQTSTVQRGHNREERKPSSEHSRPQISQAPDGITRIYVTLGRQDGLDNLASLAQYLSEKSGIDLGHFSGSGMIRDTSAHIEVDDDVAEALIAALHNTERPGQEPGTPTGEKNLIVCERAKSLPQRNFRRPPQRRGGFNPNRR